MTHPQYWSNNCIVWIKIKFLESIKNIIKKIIKNNIKSVTHLVCHTGQHYDEKMSKVFFEDLELPNPDFYLGVGGGSHAEQTAKLENHLSTNIIVSDPIGYLDFIALIANAQLIVTDSGGIQEESTYLGVQCLTLRDNTERPVTCTMGTNTLIGTNFQKAEEAAHRILHGDIKSGTIPPLWDGKAAVILRTIIPRLDLDLISKILT
jgi:UDP-N-acetylglucosamine 2-epimerase